MLESVSNINYGKIDTGNKGTSQDSPKARITGVQPAKKKSSPIKDFFGGVLDGAIGASNAAAAVFAK